MKPTQETAPDVAEAPAPKLTFAQNVIVMIKILAGFAVLGIALWGIDHWALGK